MAKNNQPKPDPEKSASEPIVQFPIPKNEEQEGPFEPIVNPEEETQEFQEEETQEEPENKYPGVGTRAYRQ